MGHPGSVTNRFALTRRRARAAAVGAVLLLAAGCGQLSSGSGASTSSESAETSAVQNADANAPTGPQVTVPGLGGSSTSSSSAPNASSSLPSSPSSLPSSSLPSAPTSSSAPNSPTGSISSPDTSSALTGPSTILTTTTTTVTPPSATSHAAATTPDTVTATRTTTPVQTSVVKVTSTKTVTPDPVTVGGGGGGGGGGTPTGGGSQSLPSGQPLAGKVIAIDPGHNGDNVNHPEIINQKIDGGNGATDNVCNTVGTETDNGYAEHAFNWGVGASLEQDLESLGATVVMTRHNDSGVGPCTPKRAQIENDAHADAVISIHGDGQYPENVHGFYVITDGHPLHGAAIAAASDDLANAVQKSMLNAGFAGNTQVGENGLFTRTDLTGLNLSTRPKILIECGNMKNPNDASAMSSSSGQAEYAKALALGVVSYLT